MSAEETMVKEPAASRPRGLLYGLIGLFGLFYAYAIWNAIAYTIPLAGLGIGTTAWVALILSIVLPAVVFLSLIHI